MLWEILSSFIPFVPFLSFVVDLPLSHLLAVETEKEKRRLWLEAAHECILR